MLLKRLLWRQVGQMTAGELRRKRWPSGEGLVPVQDAVKLLLPFTARLILDLKPLVGLQSSALSVLLQCLRSHVACLHSSLLVFA